jgi:CSLREA domain-containing protein
MSERSLRRAHERRLAAERRRETLRRRRAGLATGAAIGATALFAPAAGAATFEVNSLGDGAADACDATCTLRDAITLANANDEDDEITFVSGLTGTIRLTAGELTVNSYYALTITGPGADVLAISGDADDSGTANAGDSRIASISSSYAAATLSGLTLTEGAAPTAGAVNVTSGATVTIADSVLAGNHSTSGNGGAVASQGRVTIVRSSLTGNGAPAGGGDGGAISVDSGGVLAIADSVLSGNTARGGGAVRTSGYASATLDDTEISGNAAVNGAGGGIQSGGLLTVNSSAITGNTATAVGGGLTQSGAYAPLEISDSVISGNVADRAGGINFAATSNKYGGTPAATNTIERTTITGNEALRNGGGMAVRALNDGDELTVSHSTISGNKAAADGFGGGLAVESVGSGLRGAFRLVDSTISGNTAGTGAGAAFGNDQNDPVLGSSVAALEFDNSTIAANRAAVRGGGLYLGQYSGNNGQTSTTVSLTSSIVADNTADGAGQDLDRVGTSTGGGFDLSFSLVEAPGDAPRSDLPEGSSIFGVDPNLGALADNGGPTATHLPARTSPVIDKGVSPSRLATDQRLRPRNVDAIEASSPGGDATDIGAVELEKGPAPAAPALAAPAPVIAGAAPRPAAPARCEGVNATIVAKPGQTTLGTAGPDVIVGTAGRDEIRGGGGDDLICAGGGNDTVSGGTGDDRIIGGAGNDKLSGDSGYDRLFGGSGSDQLLGGGGADRLYGQADKDRLSGGRGNDALSGGAGDDRLVGGAGRDTFDGGPGKDSPERRKPS